MEQYYSIRGAAKIIGCSFQWIQELVKQGKLKQEWIPTKIKRIPASEIKRFLNERRYK